MRARLVAALRAQPFAVTPAQVASAQNELRKNGLPAKLVATLRARGLTAAMIDALRKELPRAARPKAKVTFPVALGDLKLAAAESAAAQALREYAAHASPCAGRC